MLVKECEETAPVFPYWKYDPFSLEDECLSELSGLQARYNKVTSSSSNST